MNNTHIQWCDYSANVIKYRDEDGKSVWACVKVSAGCTNCYAEALAKRYGRGGPFTVGATAKVTPYFDEAEAKALLSPKRLPAGSKVFIGDMTDVFGPWVPDELLDRLFAVFALRPDVVFQVLTKRPERMREYLAGGERHTPIIAAMNAIAAVGAVAIRWPLPNVWLGTSVEDQVRANERIGHLLATPAAVRFLSCEPLLGPIDAHDGLWQHREITTGPMAGRGAYAEKGVDWVICGGESGPGARPCDLGWLKSIAAQCRAAGVACFFKQVSGPRPGMPAGDPDLDGLKEFPR